MLRWILVLAATAAPAFAFSSSGGVLSLRAQSGMSRRDVCTAFGSALGLGVAALAAPQEANAVKARSGLSSPFTGEYDDPNHPGCARSVKVSDRQADRGSDQVLDCSSSFLEDEAESERRLQLLNGDCRRSKVPP